MTAEHPVDPWDKRLEIAVVGPRPGQRPPAWLMALKTVLAWARLVASPPERTPSTAWTSAASRTSITVMTVPSAAPKAAPLVPTLTKDRMFLGGARPGPRAAALCTNIAGAKRHRHEPWAYVRQVIFQLSVDASRERLAELLPERWSSTHPEHVLSHRLVESRQKARRRDQRRANRRRIK